MRKNLFIAFEGIDGSGKCMQVKLLVNKLQKERLIVLETSELSNFPLGLIYCVTCFLLITLKYNLL